MHVLRKGTKILETFHLLALTLCFLGCSESAVKSLPSDKGSRTEDSRLPPQGLSYSQSSASYTINAAVTANTPSLDSGKAISFSITPELPAGLSLDTVTGVISGTPTNLSTETSYTVSAENADGTTSTQLSLAVVDIAPSNLSYTLETANYTRYAAITNNTPSAGGGAITSYSVSPALPEGLNLDPSTGVISGTPTAYLPSSTSFSVTATNSGGSTTATIDITVDVPDGTWLGGTGTNWSTAANWKGGVAPTTGMDAYFDDACSPSCDVTIDTNISIDNLYMRSSFPGTIIQSAGRTITVGTGDYNTVGGWFQYGGTFTGGDSNIRIDQIELTGGTFTSTTAELRLGIDSHWREVDYGFTYSGTGTFNHNNGTVYLDGQGSSLGDDRVFLFSLEKILTLYNFEADIMSEEPEANGLYNNKYADISGSNPTIQVLNNFVLHDGEIRLGDIEFFGSNAHFACSSPPSRCSNMFADLRHTYASDGPDSLTGFKFLGGIAQTYSFDDGAASPFVLVTDNSNGVSTVSAGSFNVAGLNIQEGSFMAPNGTLYFGKDSHLHHMSLPDFVVGSLGSFNANGGTLIIKPSTHDSYSNSRQFLDFELAGGPLTLFNLTLDMDSGTSGSIDENYLKLSDGSHLIIDNELRIKQGRFLKNFGESASITIRGDYYQDCDDKANGSCAGADERVPKIFDTDGSTINIAAGVPESLEHPDIEINAPGGTVTINSSFSTSGNGNFTITAGTLHIANTSTVVWSDDLTNNGAITCDASSYLQVLGTVSGTPGAGNDLACYGP